MIQASQKALETVRKLFRDDYGEPFEMTEGQVGLFRAIYERQHPRLQFDCYTQYGKSDVVSMAVLLRATTFPEKWVILGATKDKAGIIMGKLIKHIFENDYTLGKFQVEEGESLDYIRRTRAKDHVTFKVDQSGIGEVVTISADARRKSADAGDILIGHGARNLVEDDAALIPDPIHGKALRMLGGHRDNFLLKVTNSFGRNHAWRSRNDPTFQKHIIDYRQGIAEGRITEEFINEMRASLDPIMFGVLYECTYPPSGMVEDGGWMPLLTQEQIEDAQKRAVQPRGDKRLGFDVAEGTNYNVAVIRTDNHARIALKNLEPDLMKTADALLTLVRDERVPTHHVQVDAVGVGAGVYSRAKQQGAEVNAFRGGAAPTEKSAAERTKDPLDFYNLRAECYWKLRLWIVEGGALETHKDWGQLATVRYRITSDKKIQIMSKEEMRARGLLSLSESTDVPDALMMTFAPMETPFAMPEASPPLAPYYPDIGF